MSTKGQVIIPKSLREQMNWGLGTRFQVEVDPADQLSIKLKPVVSSKDLKLSAQALSAKMQETVWYSGPALSDEDIKAAMTQEAMRRKT
jgi:AbrB family looped-hinge helix DNA binding protein